MILTNQEIQELDVKEKSVRVILAHTESLCPHCFKKIPAQRVQKGDAVHLVKQCPEHGETQTVIWKGKPLITHWMRPKTLAGPSKYATTIEKGCPFDCGICPAHRQRTCTALLEVTRRCNLHCPVCFADSKTTAISDLKAGEDEGALVISGQKDDPDLKTIQAWYERLIHLTGGGCNIQLSGGEPTVRDDLPRIVEMGKSMGFGFIQINSNGLRLAEDPLFVRDLKKAGLDSVFLQFDGLSDTIHQRLRGKKLTSLKERAVANCRAFNLGVVLVPTLVPGVNDGEIGDIIRFGLDHSPYVRGVHFQPISYFGRYPEAPSDAHRITLPQVIQAITDQTGIDGVHFTPPG